jgi:hypothetical protein
MKYLQHRMSLITNFTSYTWLKKPNGASGILFGIICDSNGKLFTRYPQLGTNV